MGGKTVLKPIRYGEQVLEEHRRVVAIAQDLSPLWDDFIKTNPLNESGWYNALIGWLAGAHPERFELSLV